MNKISTIYPERPKFWQKGMYRSDERFSKSEVERLLRMIEKSRLEIGKIETRLSTKERTTGKLLWLHICRFYWGLRKDILKEKVYKKQKTCVCVFKKISSDQYDDHYECSKCGCKITL